MLKTIPQLKIVAVVLAMLMLGFSSQNAMAHGRASFSFGVNVGGPGYYHHPYPYYGYAYGPRYYWSPPPVYYYQSAPVAVPVVVDPPVYVQRPSAQTVTPQNSNWYFCRESNAYYPYVKECPGGWQAVPATPPNTNE